MIIVVLFFLMIAIPSYYLGNHPPFEVMGITFSLGAVLFTPLLFFRDILHEAGKTRYITLAVILAVIATYLTVSPSSAVLACIALVWAFLIDTNIYIFVKMLWGLWPARILSDVLTTPTVPILFAFAAGRGFNAPGEELIVKFGVLALAYIGMIVFHNQRERIIAIVTR